jgi:hypothetical protein
VISLILGQAAAFEQWGKRTGTTGVLSALAKALDVSLEEVTRTGKR